MTDVDPAIHGTGRSSTSSRESESVDNSSPLASDCDKRKENGFSLPSLGAGLSNYNIFVGLSLGSHWLVNTARECEKFSKVLIEINPKTNTFKLKLEILFPCD